MKKYIVLAVVLSLLAFSIYGALAAKPNLTPTQVEVGPSNRKASVVIPNHALQVSDGVFYLGEAIDSGSGKKVEGYAFLRKKFAKPTGCNNDNVCQGWESASCGDCGGGRGETSSCYGFLAKGAKWRTAEPWVVNPANISALGSDFVFDNLSLDISKWESEASADILGNGSVTSDLLVADLNSPDNSNEVYFADIDSPGSIGLTIVWGIFRGSPRQRELVEWDQIYDDIDFDWSEIGEIGKMDFESIATHELGHSVGLDDLYEASCSEETMYGYADYGETKKRTLEAGDRVGISELY